MKNEATVTSGLKTQITDLESKLEAENERTQAVQLQLLESQAQNKNMTDELEAKNKKIGEQESKIDQQKKALADLNANFKQEQAKSQEHEATI